MQHLWYLNSLLVRNSEIHNRATRHSNINLMCPKRRGAGVLECEILTPAYMLGRTYVHTVT